MERLASHKARMSLPAIKDGKTQNKCTECGEFGDGEKMYFLSECFSMEDEFPLCTRAG